MPDNVQFNNSDISTPPSTTIVAADEIGGVKYQRTKLVFGTDGSATDVSSVAPLPVDIAFTSSNLVAINVAQSGAWNVTQSGTWSVNAVQSGSWSVNAVQSGSWSVNAVQSGSWNIGNITGTVTLPTGAATDAVLIGGTQKTKLVDGGGTNVASVSAAGALKVDASGFTQSVSGTVSTIQSGNWTTRIVGNVGSTLDAAVGAGTAPANMQAVGGIYNSTELSPSNGQSMALQLDSKGRQRTVLMDAAGNTRGVNVDASNRLSVAIDSVTATIPTVTTVTTVGTLTGGGVAHDGGDSGNPVKIGARAAATLSDDTMVANADRTDAVSDLDGALIVRSQFPLGDLLSETVSTVSSASAAFTNFGATSSTRNYVTAITVTNTSSVNTYIDFRDGTAGAVLWSVPLPGNGGATIGNGSAPLFKTTANTALAYDASTAVTTAIISVSGFKSRV